MGARGPRPMPTHLRLVTGNAGKRAVEEGEEPQFTEAAPECPEFLGDVARAEWERIVPELQAARLLTKVDMAALALYCGAYARWQQAEFKIREHSVGDIDGLGLVTSGANGYKMLTQWLIISNKAQEQLLKYLAEFGMSPSSRARVKGMAAGGQGALFGDDPMEGVLRAGSRAPS